MTLISHRGIFDCVKISEHSTFLKILKITDLIDFPLHLVRGNYWGTDSLGIRKESHFFRKHFFITELKSRDFVPIICKCQKSITRKKAMAFF